ncbi:hypothetical protein [Desulforhabdus sp. TSK]|uniref:hypothetical protein n=1 Tax=Desulforhabdus sp. TSK TaxID=2925014 RepID=UPI001FC840E4|nr:hypothetical protein [Desulforhabdus sp. TSK]GKT09750.1 hypothetical protein DSTSK_30550 [Desulforhabdus sp. TSK]
MKKLTGILGIVALGLTLAIGSAHAQPSSYNYGSGGWNCPWASGTQGSWNGSHHSDWRNTAVKGSTTGTYRNSNARSRGFHRHGPTCAHGSRYNGYCW